MSYTLVIPSRYQSTRLPGKPLADIGGKPMVQRVYEQALQSKAQRVIIATDNSLIEEVAKGFGAQVVMTSPEHLSGTDRLAEVADKLQLDASEIVVNVQGDEPLIPPVVIDQVASNLAANPHCDAATLSHAIHDTAEFQDTSAVKVVIDGNGVALYFSRAPIPWPRDLDITDESLPHGFKPQRHLGIYAYRAELLRRFVTWPAAPLEKLESLEQLRILHQGYKIHVQESKVSVPGGVDNPEDLERVRQLISARR